MTPLSRNLSVLAISLLAPLFFGCGRSDGDDRKIPAAPLAVTALGRVVPGRAVISIAASPGERLHQLLVKERDQVKASAVLAYLATHDVRKAELHEARAALEEARGRLASEVDFAEAQIALAQQGVLLAQMAVEHEHKELVRVKSLHQVEALSGHSYDDQAFLARSREQELSKAQAELASAHAGLVRAQSAFGVQSAEARVATAEAHLELSVIRAPIAGEVLRVMTYPGENIGNLPILQLGDTADMHVIAEVHEMDIRHVKLHQRATITSDAFEVPVTGVVAEIGALIYKNDVLDIDPRANTDTRVVEVRIKLDRSAVVSSLTNLEARVRIDLQTSSNLAQSSEP